MFLQTALLQAIREKGYNKPTRIQKRIIPLTIAGHDILGIAPTGTGKTAAYILPALMKLKYARGEHPNVLILGPTRELVIQIDNEIAQLCRYMNIRHTAIFGGIGPGNQIQWDSEQSISSFPERLMEAEPPAGNDE